MLRFSLSFAALALLLVFSLSTKAQFVRAMFVESPSAGVSPHAGKTRNEVTTIDVPMPSIKIKQTGLLAARLSQKDLERWKSLTRLVRAEGKKGEPLYPVLRALWEWADNSGHVIYVEVPEGGPTPTSTAGSINFEKFDPTGKHHIVVLKLNLSNIDQAVISPRVARSNGFIPFLELSKEERYVEVLGHELAHVKYVMESLLRAQLVNELIQTTNDWLLDKIHQKALLAPGMIERLSQRDVLLRELERQAEETEEVIWQELLAAKKNRAEFLTANLRRK